MILLRYKDEKTFSKIADVYDLSNSRIGQIVKKAIRKLRHTSRKVYIINGFKKQQFKISNQRELLGIIHSDESKRHREIILQQSIEILQLQIRIYNTVTRSGINTIGKLEERMNEPKWYYRYRLLSKTGAREIAEKMLQLGIIDENHPGCNLD